VKKAERRVCCPASFFRFFTWKSLLFLLKVFLNIHSFPFCVSHMHALWRISNPHVSEKRIGVSLLILLSMDKINIGDCFFQDAL